VDPSGRFDFAYNVSFSANENNEDEMPVCRHSHLYDFMWTTIDPFEGLYLKVSYTEMGGFGIAGACASYSLANTGTIDGGHLVRTSYESFGNPCGYDVVYEWYGNFDFTFTINTNEAVYKTGLAFLAIAALQLVL
jgi:hypothetical protein